MAIGTESKDNVMQNPNADIEQQHLRTLSASPLIEVAGGQIMPTQQRLPTVYLAGQR